MLGSGTSWTFARTMRVASRVEHDGAVHLRQLAQTGRGEGHVEEEAAGAQRLDRAVVAEHDQRAGASAQDALEPVAKRRTWSDGSEGLAQQRWGFVTLQLPSHDRRLPCPPHRR